MKTHKIKIEKKWLERVLSGDKTHEYRKNDRDYQTGDVIIFKEKIQPDEIRDAEALYEDDFLVHEDSPFLITHVLFIGGSSEWNNQDDMVVLSIRPITRIRHEILIKRNLK